jgi:hypothetical protein
MDGKEDLENRIAHITKLNHELSLVLDQEKQSRQKDKINEAREREELKKLLSAHIQETCESKLKLQVLMNKKEDQTEPLTRVVDVR